VTRDVTDGGVLDIAPDAVIGEGTRFHVRGGTVRVGAGAVLGGRCVVLCHERIEIGAGAMLGDDVVLVDFAHDHSDPDTPTRQQALITGAITVGEGARIGHRAVIERGAVIPRGATVSDQTVWAEGHSDPAPAAPRMKS
jgi:acetyltransferase-like isoleucine patch superfamily enzyme